MSGWQRLGVVISILWLLGAPAYFMVDANQSANRVSEMCYSTAFSKSGADLETEKSRCLAQLAELSMTPQKLLNLFFAANKDQITLWTFLLVPLAGFWMLGWIVIGTCRWISRGFRRA